MKYVWVKFHPESACSVGDTETIEDEARAKKLLEGKYIVAEDAFTLGATSEPSEVISNLEKEVEALKTERNELTTVYVDVKAEAETLKLENEALKAEIASLKAAAPKTK